MTEEPIFKVGDTVRFHDGVVINGQFVPSKNSKAVHKYEGQTAKIEEDKSASWLHPALIARFPDGGSMYVMYDGICHAHHWTIIAQEVTI